LMWDRASPLLANASKPVIHEHFPFTKSDSERSR